jgi:hypothetical protein
VISNSRALEGKKIVIDTNSNTNIKKAIQNFEDDLH